MHSLDLTLPSAAANLACDEALLEACEEDAGLEVMRFWEPKEYFVVLGFSNSASKDVNLDACRKSGVAVFRRCSGGGTVLQGPGCLNYSLILQITNQLETIPATNQYIMGIHREVLSSSLGKQVDVRGHTDLALAGRKFSGNAQRRKRRALLFHGAFLLAFDIPVMEKFLTMPSREPDYRRGRPHADFLMNLDIPAQTLKKNLRDAWSAGPELTALPDCRQLIAEKYSRDEWNLKF